MDPLSDLLSLLKPKSYITAGFDAAGDWALALDDLKGRIKCYAVMRGSCWVRPKPGEAVCIKTGECFVLPSGREIVVAGSPDATPRPASEVLDPNSGGNVITVNGGGDCYLVGSRFEVNGRHAEMLLQSLPSLIHIRTADSTARLRIWLEMMMEEMRATRVGSSLMAQQLSHMMLIEALRLHVEQARSPRRSGNRPGNRRDPRSPWLPLDRRKPCAARGTVPHHLCTAVQGEDGDHPDGLFDPLADDVGG